MKNVILRVVFACVCAALVSVGNVLVIDSAHAADKPNPVADVPMILIGDRVAAIQVDIGARHGLNVIVDTGATDEILDAALAKELGIAVTAPQMVDQPGGAVAIGKTTGVDAAVGDAALKSWPFVTAPLRGLEAFLGRPFDGILGQALFDRFVVEFDYAACRLRLYDPATFVYTGTGTVLPMERPDGRLFVHARLEGSGHTSAEALLQVDTGSFEALGLEGPDVERLHLVPDGAPRGPLFGLAIGGETSGYRTRFASVTFGSIRLHAPIASVTTSANASDDPVSVGVVGGEILRRFKVIVAASRNQIILEPAASLREKFNGDVNGIIFASPRPFASLVVYKVLEGSPGAEAGLRAGDELIELDGKPVATLGLDKVSHALQISDRRYRLKIRRDGTEISLSLVTRPILR